MSALPRFQNLKNIDTIPIAEGDEDFYVIACASCIAAAQRTTFLRIFQPLPRTAQSLGAEIFLQTSPRHVSDRHPIGHNLTGQCTNVSYVDFSQSRHERKSSLASQTTALIGFDGGDTNLMAYVANDPINAVDPSGLASICTVPGTLYNHVMICVINSKGTETFKGLYQDPGNSLGDTIFGGKGKIYSDDKTNSCQDVGSGCMDTCLSNVINSPPPSYSFVNGGGVNCQKFANNAVAQCKAQCPGK
jgi:hypothetical protein